MNKFLVYLTIFVVLVNVAMVHADDEAIENNDGNPSNNGDLTPVDAPVGDDGSNIGEEANGGNMKMMFGLGCLGLVFAGGATYKYKKSKSEEEDLADKEEDFDVDASLDAALDQAMENQKNSA